MVELPSRYSSVGMSKSDQKKTITTPRPGGDNKKAVSYKLTVRVNEAFAHNSSTYGEHVDNGAYDADGDIPMIGMNDEDDVEVVTDFVTRTRKDVSYSTEMLKKITRYDNSQPSEGTGASHLVVDTNFMISHLDIVDSLSKLNTTYQHKIVIPTTVFKELDGLKGSTRVSQDDGSGGKTIGLLARWANDWIYKQLANSNPSVRSQKLYECLDKSTLKDDSILDCCLYFKHKEKASIVILLSNDKNLCMKALGNEILTVSYRKDMTAELIAQTIHRENTNSSNSRKSAPSPAINHQYLTDGNISYHLNQPCSQRMGDSSPQNSTSNGDLEDDIIGQYSQRECQTDIQDINIADEDVEMQSMDEQRSPANHQQNSGVSHLLSVDTLPQAVRIIFPEITKVVLGAIDFCMVEEYGDELDLVGYDPSKVDDLRSASDTLIQYYVSVFTEYFRQSTFKPFPTKGKKVPQFTHIYADDEVLEVVQFVKYWCEVLRCLYFKRDKNQNDALERCIERWVGALRPFV